MATLQKNPLFPPGPKETASDYPRSAGHLCAGQEDRQDRSVRHLSGWGDYHEYTRYSPSILLVADSATRLTQIEGWLKSKGCQVTGVYPNMLASASQQYFDLIIVDLDSFEGVDPDETLFAVVQKLKAYPELSLLPLIILTGCNEIRGPGAHSLAGRPIYYLGQGPATEAILLQIVAQIHYLTYRYV